MRLTLRTMLAYLDDILEPEDSDDISKKIEESEFATNLVHRTRDVMRRLRLGVPPLSGRGLAADPNTVAEYLDNTLATDRVPEFEKICLESDAHLAEVAACHQILTLVLGEPAEIKTDSRQRMYALATHVDAPPVQSDAVRMTTAAVSAPAQPVAPPAVPRRAKPEVPEYLRESRSRFWPVAATVLVAALLTGGALMLLGPAQWRERAVALFSFSRPDIDETDEGKEAAEGQPANAEAPADALGPGEPDAAAAIPQTAPVDANDPDAMPADADDDVPPAEPAPVDDALGKTERGGTRLPAAPAPPVAAPERASLPPADTATDEPPAASPKADMPAEPERGDSAPAVRQPSEPESFGRYHSQQGELMLRWDADAAEWRRLAPMSPLAKGDRLLSIPSYRPMITLTSNITVRADGPALLELIGWTDQGVPIVGVEFGRLWIMTVGKPDNSIVLKLDEHQPELTFVDADSTAAIEVRRALPLGKDPEAGLAPLSAELFATSGSIRLADGEAALDLQAPARRLLFAPAADQPASNDFPKWVSVESLPEIDRQAAVFLEPLLLPDKPVALALKEYSDHKRREVRSLAARSLCYLGSFDACTQELNESRYKALWPAYLDELRAALTRGPETAAQVRTTLERQRGADAPMLYRMLWGYSNEDLKNGADRDLVEALDNESLDIRVLSLLNLKNVSGATHGYQPEELTVKRRTALAVWRKLLKDGKIASRGAASTSKSKAAKGDRPGS